MLLLAGPSKEPVNDYIQERNLKPKLQPVRHFIILASYIVTW
jgi:hypothetical protein